MENEMMEVMNEVVEETIPTTQAIAEETLVPAAQEVVQEAVKAATVDVAPATGKKHSSAKTIIFVAGLVGIALIKPVRKGIKKRKEKKRREMQEMIEAAVDAALTARMEGAKQFAADRGEETTETKAEQAEQTVIEEPTENK